MKKGDKVRCIDAFASRGVVLGKIYTIEAVYGIYCDLDEDGLNGLRQDRFEPITQAELSAVVSREEQIKELEEKLRVLKAEKTAEEWKGIVEKASVELLKAGMPGYGVSHSVRIDDYVFSVTFD